MARAPNLPIPLAVQSNDGGSGGNGSSGDEQAAQPAPRAGSQPARGRTGLEDSGEGSGSNPTGNGHGDTSTAHFGNGNGGWRELCVAGGAHSGD